jgi:hypothetical protein
VTAVVSQGGCELSVQGSPGLCPPPLVMQVIDVPVCPPKGPSGSPLTSRLASTPPPGVVTAMSNVRTTVALPSQVMSCSVATGAGSELVGVEPRALRPAAHYATTWATLNGDPLKPPWYISRLMKIRLPTIGTPNFAVNAARMFTGLAAAAAVTVSRR